MLQTNIKNRLEQHFHKNPKPNAQEIACVAIELNLEKEVRLLSYVLLT